MGFFASYFLQSEARLAFSPLPSNLSAKNIEETVSVEHSLGYRVAERAVYSSAPEDRFLQSICMNLFHI